MLSVISAHNPVVKLTIEGCSMQYVGENAQKIEVVPVILISSTAIDVLRYFRAHFCQLWSSTQLFQAKLSSSLSFTAAA